MNHPPLNQYTNIPAHTTTLVRTGKGKLSAIICNKAVAGGVVTVCDALTNTTPKIATITQPNPLLKTQWRLEYNVCFQIGLTVVTSADDDITVCWEPM